MSLTIYSDKRLGNKHAKKTDNKICDCCKCLGKRKHVPIM